MPYYHNGQIIDYTQKEINSPAIQSRIKAAQHRAEGMLLKSQLQKIKPDTTDPAELFFIKLARTEHPEVYAAWEKRNEEANAKKLVHVDTGAIIEVKTEILPDVIYGIVIENPKNCRTVKCGDVMKIMPSSIGKTYQII